MTPITRSLITASSATLIALASLLGNLYLAIAIGVLIFFAALGWPSIMRIAQRRVASAIMIISGAIAVVSVALGRGEPYLRYAVAAAAAAILLALASEIFFPSPRGRAVASVSGLATGGLATVSAAAWLAAARTPGQVDLVVAAAVTIAVAAIASTSTRKANINGGLAVILAGGAGALMGVWFATLTVVGGLLIGIAAAASVLIISETARREPAPRNIWAGIASGITPVLVAGALVYLGARLLVG